MTTRTDPLHLHPLAAPIERLTMTANRTTPIAGLALDLDAFPPDFLWGAATSAYQIEGAVSGGGRGPSIWDTYTHTPGKTLHGDTGDIACDHYHRWREDLELVHELGLNAYRLSLSWARLQPGGTGRLNQSAVDYYRGVLGRLREIGVRPFVTLYHWDLPQSLETAGGWPSRDTSSRFADYVGLVSGELGDLATDWITLNEPWCSAFLGYGSGAHAPGRMSLPDAVAAAHHLNLAHGLAVQAVRAVRPAAAIGVAEIITDIVPDSDSREDVAAARRLDANNNRMFLDPVLRGRYPDDVLEMYAGAGLLELAHDGDAAIISAPLDFLAVNHYHQVIARNDPLEPHLKVHERPAEPASTSLGWSIRPESLRNILLRITREYPALPLYVTENGASFEDYVDPTGAVCDSERIDYLRGYLGAAAQAIREGVNLKGYFAWSLMDNFEWAEGYRKRFGLIYVDFATQARIPKASAVWYRDLIGQHARAVG